ncbi:hypothetical protein GCM10023088_41070 [Actinomadura verrucosospora]|uniref:hypothetical protein n=1 Tax=Actinomadura verrucosospora TaxID=46165 RepID=UPI0031EDFC70
MSDEQLTRMLRSAAGGHPIPSAPIEAVVHRGRRARRRRRTAAGALGTGAIALVAAAATLGGNLVSGGGDGDRVITPGRGGDVTLAAATEATAGTTFHVKLTWTLSSRGRRETVETYQGAFDAPHRRGYLRGPGSVPMEQRFIGDDRYVLRGKAWRKLDHGLNGLTRGTTGPQELTADPGRMLRMLATFGTLTPQGRSGSGATAVQTYAFSHAARPAEGSPAGTRITGTVTIGIATRKIQKIVQTTVITTATPEIADRDPVRFTSVTEFSDYGTPVNVTRPSV